jgi:hypothetical protein
VLGSLVRIIIALPEREPAVKELPGLRTYKVLGIALGSMPASSDALSSRACTDSLVSPASAIAANTDSR